MRETMSLTDAIIVCNMNGCTVKGIGTNNIEVQERKTNNHWAFANVEAFIKFVKANIGGR